MCLAASGVSEPVWDCVPGYVELGAPASDFELCRECFTDMVGLAGV